MRCFGVIAVGVSPAATELHRIVSSNPGAEKNECQADRLCPSVLQTDPGMRRNKHQSSRMDVALLITQPNMSRSGLEQQYFILPQVPVL